MGLTLAWPRDVVLVDADRAASQTVLAGYLNDVQTGGRGLTSLTQLWRDGLDLASDLPKHMVEMPGTDTKDTPHWFIPGFARPGSSTLFEPVWFELMDALAGLDRQGIDVILDAGRWGAQGLPAAVMASTRQLVMVTRSSLPALATLRLYVPDVTAAASAVPACTTRLVVVGPGLPYSAREIADHFKLPTDGLPWQPEDAAHLSDGMPSRHWSNKRPLTRAYIEMADKLRAAVDQWDAQFDRVPSRSTHDEAAAEGVPAYV